MLTWIANPPQGFGIANPEERVMYQAKTGGEISMLGTEIADKNWVGLIILAVVIIFFHDFWF